MKKWSQCNSAQMSIWPMVGWSRITSCGSHLFRIWSGMRRRTQPGQQAIRPV